MQTHMFRNIFVIPSTFCLLSNLHAFLSSADFFFKINFFEKKNESQDQVLSGLIWIQVVCEGYQQTTQIGTELLDTF